MKKQFVVLLAIVFVFSSCYYEDNFDTNFDDDQSWNDDDQDQGYDDEEGSLTLYQVNENNISKIKDYPVASNLQSFQLDYDKHFKMWEFVTRLLPIESRNQIVQFEVFHGAGDLLGYVIPINDQDLGKWKFALAIDAAEELENIDFKDLFTFVTLHEYGHILTLNNAQVAVSESNSCANYFTGEGCSGANSYINRLYELGWMDIINEVDEDNPYALYDKYPNRFVSDYAATNPGEDVAEVWSYFVINNEQPTGNTIADQKIKLLYEYPELVELRRKIRANGNTPSARAAAKWRENPMYSRVRICGKRVCKH